MTRGTYSFAAVLTSAMLACTSLAHAQSEIPVKPLGPRPDTQQAPDPLTDAKIVTALKRGVDYLLAHQKGGNNWESGTPWIRNGQIGGETALAVYALLHAGESLRDDSDYGPKLMYHSDAMKGAVDYLCNLEPQETYVAALQACALSRLPRDPDNKKPGSPEVALLRAQKFLMSATGPQGGYSYEIPKEKPAGFFGDLSNAQYAALGMWALEDAGLKAPPAYWLTTDKFWRSLQSIDGSWPYKAVIETIEPTRDTMGLAGIASLFISQEFTDKTLRGAPKDDEGVKAGLAWLDRSFVPNSGNLYYMYGVERIGLASGIRFFGKTDWYRTCAQDIINHQNRDGSWDYSSWFNDGPGGGRIVDGHADSSDNGGFTGNNGTTATAFALLFLARGRNPVLFNKLQYDGPWNARPLDDAFATRWISHKLERPMNWQIVDMRINSSQWLDAPILLITGSKDPHFTAKDLEQFRTFMESGGMIFSSADQGDPVFTNAIKKYAAAAVDNKYDMRTLTAKDALLSRDLNGNMTSPPQLLGLSNGLREMWVHSPVDMGASWQLQRTTTTQHFETIESLYSYVTGRGNLKAGLRPLPEEITPATKPGTPTLAVARISYNGNWDPEPGAWDNFADWARNRDRAHALELQVTPVPLKELNAEKTPIIHITGTAKANFKADDCELLRRFLQNGGTVIAEAAGGNSGGSDFLDSFMGMLQVAVPGSKAVTLPPGHAIYTGKFESPKDAPAGGAKVEAGDDVQKIQFRRYGEITRKQKIAEPTVEAIEFNGQPRIFILRYDLTEGLLGTETWGITGYEPESARKLMENLLRFASK